MGDAENRALKRLAFERGVLDEMFSRGSAFGQMFAGAVSEALTRLIDDGRNADKAADRIAANKFIVTTAVKIWETSKGLGDSKNLGLDLIGGGSVNTLITKEIEDIAKDPRRIAELLAETSEEADDSGVQETH